MGALTCNRPVPEQIRAQCIPKYMRVPGNDKTAAPPNGALFAFAHCQVANNKGIAP